MTTEIRTNAVQADVAANSAPPADAGRRGRRSIDTTLKVQLGCFDRPAEGWVNADITPHIFISRVPFLASLMHSLGFMTSSRYDQHRNGVFRRIRYINLAKRLPFKDNSVDAYFTSHTLEHLYLFQTQSVLREMFRTLKPGAFARIVLPDLNQAMSLYNADDPAQFLKFVFEADKPSLSKNHHRWMFTAEYLKRLLKEAGFENVWIREYQRTNYEPFVELDNRPDNSLYVEAQKA